MKQFWQRRSGCWSDCLCRVERKAERLCQGSVMRSRKGTQALGARSTLQAMHCHATAPLLQQAGAVPVRLRGLGRLEAAGSTAGKCAGLAAPHAGLL